jgi:hypothetical protein
MAAAVRAAAAEVVRDHGVRGFALGMPARVLWLSAGGALFLGFYEATVAALGQAPH